MKQQNKNFILNVGYQLLTYLLPLFSAGYTSRVLGTEGLGLYSYVTSVVAIFGMFCLLGISKYGNREIARVRDDPKTLAEKFSSIYTLQLLLTMFVLGIYILSVIFLPFEHRIIYYIQIIHFFSVACDVTWFFFGLEQFRITLTRSFVVKLVSVILVVLLVKSPNDIWLYTLIMVLSSLFSQVVMLVLSRRYVKFKVSSFKAALSHFKGCLILFIPVLAYNIYRIMDKTMIGAISTKTELAYYENAERLINVPIMIISALGTVMLPHMVHAMHNETEDYKKTIKFSMKLAMNIACFSALGLAVVGRDISVLIFGQAYEYCGFLIIPLATTVIASAWANVIRTQFLVPKGYDRIYVSSTIIGAGINLILNLIFIRRFGSSGACIGTILAEFSIAVYQTFFVRKDLEILVYFKDFMVAFVKAVVVLTFVLLIGFFIDHIYVRLLLQVLLAVVLFVVFNRKLVFYEFLGLPPKKAPHLGANRDTEVD